MKDMRTRFNPKRQIDQEVSSVVLESLSERLTYGGNPEHKRNPGDFGLAPPASPRPDKSLCDEINVFTRREAVDLLREGVRRSLISKQQVRGLPQNIWAVTAR